MSHFSKQPVLVLTRNPTLQDAVTKELMKESKYPFLFSPDLADFISALDLRTLVLVGDDLADEIDEMAHKRVPGWSTGRFKPQFDGLHLLTQSGSDLDDLIHLKQMVHASFIVRIPFEDLDLQRLRKQLAELDPPF